MTIEQAVDCISLLDENQRRGYLTHLHKQLGIKPLRTMDEPDWMEAKGIRDYE